MKVLKVIKIIFLVLIIAFLLYWLTDIAKCEINTIKYSNEFENVGDLVYPFVTYKVIDYQDNYAEIYWVSSGKGWKNGNIYNCKKDNDGNWYYYEWNTVWSNKGSADGFIWPYIR